MQVQFYRELDVDAEIRHELLCSAGIEKFGEKQYRLVEHVPVSFTEGMRLRIELVEEVNPEPVTTLQCKFWERFELRSNVCALNHIFTRPAARKQGLAMFVLGILLDLCRCSGIEVVTASVHQSNRGSQNFHLKAGFKRGGGSYGYKNFDFFLCES